MHIHDHILVFSADFCVFVFFLLLQIWIRPEQHPKQLTAIFSNLTDMTFWNIFPECDLSWTLFILEAAPALQKLIVSLLLYLLLF
jgi:hypothetical protein